jgi:hypothetical protein
MPSSLTSNQLFTTLWRRVPWFVKAGRPCLMSCGLSFPKPIPKRGMDLPLKGL